METLEQCTLNLRKIGDMALRFRPKSDDAINLFRETMDMAVTLEASEIVRLRSVVEQNLAFKLMYLSVLAAERVMNSREPGWLRAALMGHVVEGFQLDPRENYLRLYAVEYGAYRAGLDHKKVVRELTPLMDKVTRERFANVFSSRYGEVALKLANLKLETGPDGALRFIAAT